MGEGGGWPGPWIWPARVVGGRDSDQVGADDVEAAQTEQDLSACHVVGPLTTGVLVPGVGGIEEVDVDGQVGGSAPTTSRIRSTAASMPRRNILVRTVLNPWLSLGCASRSEPTSSGRRPLAGGPQEHRPVVELAHRRPRCRSGRRGGSTKERIEPPARRRSGRPPGWSPPSPRTLAPASRISRAFDVCQHLLGVSGRNATSAQSTTRAVATGRPPTATTCRVFARERRHLPGWPGVRSGRPVDWWSRSNGTPNTAMSTLFRSCGASAPSEGGRARPGHPRRRPPPRSSSAGLPPGISLTGTGSHRSRITTPVVRLSQATRPADAARGRPASGDTSRGRRTGRGGAPAATTRRGWERPRTRS